MTVRNARAEVAWDSPVCSRSTRTQKCLLCFIPFICIVLWRFPLLKLARAHYYYSAIYAERSSCTSANPFALPSPPPPFEAAHRRRRATTAREKGRRQLMPVFPSLDDFYARCVAVRGGCVPRIRQKELRAGRSCSFCPWVKRRNAQSGKRWRGRWVQRGTAKKDIATRCAPRRFFCTLHAAPKKARKMIMHQDITFSCPSPREEEVPCLSRAGKERWSDIYVPLLFLPQDWNRMNQ